MEEKNFTCNTEGFTLEKLVFLWIFSRIPFRQHTELKREHYCQQAKWSREGKANMMAPTPHPPQKEESIKRKCQQIVRKAQAIRAAWHPSKSSQVMFYLHDILYIPAVPLVYRVLESLEFFPSRVLIINNHNLAHKQAIPSGSDKRSWHLSNPSHLHCFILFVYWSFYARNANWHLIIQLS